MNAGQVSGIALRLLADSLCQKAPDAREPGRRPDTAFSGSLQFVYIRIVWFTAWIIINVSPWAFDPSRSGC
jgi:hypothetical protein